MNFRSILRHLRKSGVISGSEAARRLPMAAAFAFLLVGCAQVSRIVPPPFGVSEVQAVPKTYYIRRDGLDTNLGTTNSPSGAWKTLNQANTHVAPGDRVIIVNLTGGTGGDSLISDAIAPAVNGTQLLPITYQGDVTNPAAIGLANLRITRQYISVRGLRFRGTAAFKPLFAADKVTELSKCIGDTISWCIMPRVAYDMAKQCWARYNVVRGLAGNEAVSFHNHLDGQDCPNSPCVGDNYQCGFDHNTVTGTISGQPTRWFEMVYSHECVVDSNSFVGTFHWDGGAVDGDLSARKLIYSKNNTFFDNRWDFEANNYQTGISYWNIAWIRDSSDFNTFLRDTVRGGVSSGYNMTIRLANSGNPGIPGGHNNIYRNCFYKATSYIDCYDVFDHSVIDSSVFISRDAMAFRALYGSVGSTFAFNTFYGKGTGQGGDVFGFQGAPSYPTTGNSLTSNVFYADSISADSVFRSSHSPQDSYKTGISFYVWGGGNSYDRNLYYTRAGIMRPTYRDSFAVGYEGSGTYTLGGFLVDATHPWDGGSPGIKGDICRSFGKECTSLYGDPLFINTAFSNFDGRVGYGSPADTLWHHTWNNLRDHVGAFKWNDTYVPDSAAIFLSRADLLSGTENVYEFTLNWTNPSDRPHFVAPLDTTQGPQCATIEIATSNSIDGAQPNASNFDTYKIFSTMAGVPGTSGEYTFFVTATPTINPDYFFTLRVIDRFGNKRYSSIKF